MCCPPWYKTSITKFTGDHKGLTISPPYRSRVSHKKTPRFP
ncbi:hypothetical protein AHIS2_p053 [Acaryochloris phage A-HIS2]|nr:hypothetical protein AHIS2_p053 [Acaryochloris phage A-HIS2]